jgi:hypothetical protein
MMNPYLLFAVSLAPSLTAGYVGWWMVERCFLARQRPEAAANRLLAE